jgi:hypothetical protein
MLRPSVTTKSVPVGPRSRSAATNRSSDSSTTPSHRTPSFVLFSNRSSSAPSFEPIFVLPAPMASRRSTSPSFRSLRRTVEPSRPALTRTLRFRSSIGPGTRSRTSSRRPLATRRSSTAGVWPLRSGRSFSIQAARSNPARSSSSKHGVECSLRRLTRTSLESSRSSSFDLDRIFDLDRSSPGSSRFNWLARSHG